MRQTFTAVFKKKGKWYLGWIEEVPGVNTQGKTLREVRGNIKEALRLILDVNRELVSSEIKGRVIRESLIL
ncbi:type II toxin-antitoxin system HicB family antitoxin [Candidatus Uhrbacteria bacterium]|nr:type II toxin-antitoxin system HicB family antitoxin [Candidatus Uhrbacteria bacterium]